jgi:hypothetical protein
MDGEQRKHFSRGLFRPQLPRTKRYGNLPRLGDRDVNPTGYGQAGMLMDPVNMGVVPPTPVLPEYIAKDTENPLKEYIDNGMKFDPLMPPNVPFKSTPEPYKPPDYDFPM